MLFIFHVKCNFIFSLIERTKLREDISFHTFFPSISILLTIDVHVNHSFNTTLFFFCFWNNTTLLFTIYLL